MELEMAVTLGSAPHTVGAQPVSVPVLPSLGSSYSWTSSHIFTTDTVDLVVQRRKQVEQTRQGRFRFLCEFSHVLCLLCVRKVGDLFSSLCLSFFSVSVGLFLTCVEPPSQYWRT